MSSSVRWRRLAIVLLLILVVLFGTEIVWREREAGIAEIVDATPVPSFVFLAAKLVAVTLMVLAILGVATAVGIAYQLAKGVTRIDLHFYLVNLFVLIGLQMVMIAVLATFVQALVNQKYIGLVVILILVIVIPLTVHGFEVRLPLLHFATHPDVPLSDMNQFGHFLPAAFWFLAYWACVSVLLGVATHALWIRGIPASLLDAAARHANGDDAGRDGGRGRCRRRHGGRRLVHLLEHARPQRRSSRPRTRGSAPSTTRRPTGNSRRCRSRGSPRSRWRSISIRRPAASCRAAAMSWSIEAARRSKPSTCGSTTMFPSTRSSSPIPRFVDAQPRFNHFIFRPAAPLAPGEARTLTFAVSKHRKGFKSQADLSSVLFNGTFVRNDELAPSIGVSSARYLQDEKQRKAHGLVPFAETKLDEKILRNRGHWAGDSDFIRFAITLSTSADQIALAPGYVEREWSADGRRYFRYAMDTPILNFWSVLSARYVVARDKWNDVDIAIYFHPGHEMNVPRMIDAVKESLAYYSENFGPYQHRQMRIVEFPGYFDFAQSFPNTVPYSEAAGFIADNRNPDLIDYVWYLTAHEVAHQWWGHQVAGAALPGEGFLSEALAQYSSLMVMERRYGAAHMRRFLSYELDKYLSQRGLSQRGEPPLVRAEGQGHIRYNKGARCDVRAQGRGRRSDRQSRAGAARARAWPQDQPLHDGHGLHPPAAQGGRQGAPAARDRPVRADHALGPAGCRLGGAADGRRQVARAHRRAGPQAGRRRAAAARKRRRSIRRSTSACSPPIRGGGNSPPRTSSFWKSAASSAASSRSSWSWTGKPAFVGIDPYIKLIQRNTASNVAPLASSASN